MRASGVRDMLIYCRDRRCSHSTTISADRWPENIRLSDVEPDFVCTACGKRGAEIRPKFTRAKMGASLIKRCAPATSYTSENAAGSACCRWPLEGNHGQRRSPYHTEKRAARKGICERRNAAGPG